MKKITWRGKTDNNEMHIKPHTLALTLSFANTHIYYIYSDNSHNCVHSHTIPGTYTQTCTCVQITNPPTQTQYNTIHTHTHTHLPPSSTNSFSFFSILCIRTLVTVRVVYNLVMVAVQGLLGIWERTRRRRIRKNSCQTFFSVSTALALSVSNLLFTFF